MKSLSPAFLTQNASVLQWSFGLVILDLILTSFFANQGYWELESGTADSICKSLSIFLLVFVIYRLVRPRGVQPIQAMMLLLLLPKTETVAYFLIQQTLVALVVLQGGLRRKEMYSLLALAVIALPAPILSIVSTQHSARATTKTGQLISCTDQFYELYRFDSSWRLPPTYRLFRILPACPGLRTVKEIDAMTSAAPVQVTRSETGKYSIEASQGPPAN